MAPDWRTNSLREQHSLPWPLYGSAEQRPLIATSPPLAPGIEVSGEVPTDPPETSRVDLSIARALLALALLLVAVYGTGVARHVPVYGPLDEIYHTGYVQQLADSGRPPIVGRDHIILGLGQTRPNPDFVVIRGLDHPYDVKSGKHVTPVFPDGTVFEQNEAIQPPLYYVLMTPVALLVPWSHRVLVMRLLGTAFVMLAVLLLYAAVREVSPHRPLAAGLAAAIMGSMAGITSMLSQVQNDALLLPLCVATFWLLARDLRRRRSGLYLPLVAGASAVTQLIAAPAAVVVVLAAIWGEARLRNGAWRLRAGRRLIAARIGALALPVLPWIAFNLHEYRWFWPIARSAVAGAPAAPHNWRLVELLPLAGVDVFSGLWLQLWPLHDGGTPADSRPSVVIAIVIAVALILALRSGVLLRERLRLGYWAAVMVVSFASVYLVLSANAASVGGTPDFVARYFVAFGAAYAAFAGTAVTLVGTGRPWVARGCACGLALLLAWQMLDLAYPWLVG